MTMQHYLVSRSLALQEVFELAGNVSEFRFTDTGEVDPAGRFALYTDGNAFYLGKGNLAVGSTFTPYFQITSGNAVSIAGNSITLRPPGQSVASAAGATFSAVIIPAITTTLTGTTTITAMNGLGLNLGIPALTNTSAGLTLTTASTLYIAGAPTAAGNLTITNRYALLIASGNLAFGAAASILTAVGALTLAPVSGSDLALTVAGVGNIAVTVGTGTMTGVPIGTGWSFSGSPTISGNATFSGNIILSVVTGNAFDVTGANLRMADGARLILGVSDPQIYGNAGVLTFRTGGLDRLTLNAGAFAFQQASTISTTVGALTLAPVSGSNLVLTTAGAGSNVFVSLGPLQLGGAANTTANQFNPGTQGAASTTMFIGNASINVTSDVRVKSNILAYQGDALALLRGLPVKEFDYLEGARPFGGIYTGRYVGFTAQDLFQVAPWAVNTQGGADCWECRAGLRCELHLPWQARYEFTTGLIVKAIQEQDDEIAMLKARLAVLEGVVK